MDRMKNGQRSLGGWLASMVVGLTTVAALAGTLRVPGEYPTIQAAIDAASDGDRVLVSDGVYSGAGNVDLDLRGKAIAVRSARGPGACIIECNGSPEDPHRGFVFQSGEPAGSLVEGFTIRGGATENGAVDDRFNGGAILVTQESRPTLRNLVITGNSAACWGAGISCSRFGHATIVDCVFIGNASGDDGGALFVWDGGSALVINTLMAQNTADVTGGAVTNFGGEITLINCTLADNATRWGGGVFDGVNACTLTNCIVSGNAGDQQIYGAPVVSYSSVEGGFAGEGNIDAAPNFADRKGGNYRLASGSPCIDAGNNFAVPGDVTTDLDGGARFQDDFGTPDTGLGAAPVVDMGPHEFSGGPPCTGGERIAKTRCRPGDGAHGLIVKLKGGTPGDAFAVRLSTGETEYGTLSDRGKGVARFQQLFGEERGVEAQWSCGARDTSGYVCP